MAMYEKWFEQDLQKPIAVRMLTGNLFSMDNEGNKIGVRVFDGGEAATLSGTVSGNVIRQDGGTVSFEGTLENGNEAYIVLPQAAYAVPGIVTITIKITSSGVVTTLAAMTAVVYRTSTDTAIDPGTIIPDITTLISAINTAVASIPADYSSLWATLAPNFSSSTAYVAGQYVTYNVAMYRFTTDHAAGSWNSAHVVSVNIGSELSALKSALSETTVNLLKIRYTGDAVASNAHILSVGNGIFIISGTASSETVQEISNDITLPAGTYTFGVYPYITDVNADIQIRKIVGGVDKGNLTDSTRSKKNFTLDSETTVRLRIHILSSGTFNNDVIQPMLTLSSAWPDYGFIGNVSAVDGVARYWEQFGYRINDFMSTDLNDCVEQGIYILAAGTTYSNRPSDIGAISGVLIVCKNYDLTNNFRIQMLYDYSHTRFYVRKRNGATPPVWDEWTKAFTDNSLNYMIRSISGVSDFNDFTEQGVYVLSGSVQYTNSPIQGVATSALVVYRSHDLSSAYRIQMFYDYTRQKVYMRRRAGAAPGTWESWILLVEPIDKYMQNHINTVSESFTPSSQSSQGANTGIKIRIMSYNICGYHNDTAYTENPVYISNEKLFNLKKMFYKANADIVCCQEDAEKIDGASGTKRSENYVFYPVYPYSAGQGATTIRSKIQIVEENILKYTTVGDVRSLRYATIDIDDKRLLIVSTHPGITEEARSVEYEDLFDWVERRKTLKTYSGDVDVYAPEHTHCIICGDMNSLTSSDKTLLETLSEEDSYILGNGGAIGWFYTNLRSTPKAIDNIIVSDNIIINNIEAYNDWYDLLYSDHIPVIADLTLLDE